MTVWLRRSKSWRLKTYLTTESAIAGIPFWQSRFFAVEAELLTVLLFWVCAAMVSAAGFAGITVLVCAYLLTAPYAHKLYPHGAPRKGPSIQNASH